MKDTVLANELLNGVWQENINKVKWALEDGANPNWIFNGYPILLHAVYLDNKEIVECLINAGATQLSEALALALDEAIGDMILYFFEMGVLPKVFETNESIFGDHPNRYIADGIIANY